MTEFISDWNQKIVSNPDKGNVFQSYEFAEIKKTQGWRVYYEYFGGVATTVLEKSIFGFGKLWYVPKGPGVNSVEDLRLLLPELKSRAKKAGVFAVKIEPEILKSDENSAAISKLSLQKVRPIQPNFSTVLLDISADLDTILKNLNQKGRHAIRRAERDGVTALAVEASDENCRVMYDLLAETAAGSFSIRSFAYYKQFWQSFSKAGMGQLFFAYVNNQVVAAAYALTMGQKSTYKDGASVRQRTTYGASHLLQWEVIKWAKTQGACLHDLCGAPPSDQINNPDHPHYGIGRFKTSFNKQVTDYVGAYDIVIRPLAYRFWQQFGERLASKLHRLVKKEGLY